MLASHFRQQMRVVRQITVGATEGVTIDATVGRWFPALLLPPRANSTEEAPRDKPPALLHYTRHLSSDPPTLRAGDRAEIEGDTTYELLGNPRELRTGRRVIGWVAPAIAADDLYPLTGTLEEKDGTDVVAALPLSIVGGPDRHTDTGEYEDRPAEAPIEHAAVLTRNRRILVGGQRHNVVSASTDYAVPRVRLTLRRIGG